MSAQAFGNYQLLKRLATGGMAEVWLARQVGISGFNRLCVVKRILPHLADEEEFVQMFLNEAKIAARFNHPNIAQIYDLGETNGSYFIAMEFISGEDLGRVMRKAWSSGQWIARPLAIRIVASACEGLYYAHTKTDENGRPLKVVHRDISPQNILISFDGSVKLVDFGIAKAADQASMTRSGAIKGKFSYMSPEQAAGKNLDHRSDIYALGLVLYELITGVRPLKRESDYATLQAALEGSIEPPSAVVEVPSELDSVVMRALARGPDERYRDARAFQMALEEFLVSQRLVASSVQLSELMTTLFAERLQEEARLGVPQPSGPDAGSNSKAPAQVELSGTEKASSLAKNTADMEWEAPPASAVPSRDQLERPGRALGSRGTPVSAKREPPPLRSSESALPPPAGSEPPPRRVPSNVATTIARTPSRPSLPKIDVDAVPTFARDGDDDSLRPLPSSTVVPRRRSSSVEVVRSEDIDASFDDDAPDEATLAAVEPEPERTPPKPVRRKTGAALPAVDGRRRPSRAEMPEAPPRKVKRAPAKEALDPEAVLLRRRRLQALATGGVLLAVAAAGFVFRDTLWTALNRTPNDGLEISVKVTTHPANVQVTLVHPELEGKVDPLGAAPLTIRAHIGDRIVLSNPDLGIYLEEVLSGVEPGKTKVIDKEFKEEKVELEIEPKGLKDISVREGNRKVGSLPGPAFKLYEGKHKLELVGMPLKERVVFDVEVKPGQPVKKKLNLRPHLAQ